MTEQILINGERAIYGRLCSFVAKKAILGNEVIILNSEKVIISGNKNLLIDNYIKARAKGGRSMKGPKISRITTELLRKGIRGMLPDFRRGAGKAAYKKIKCYEGIPKEYSGKDALDMKSKYSRNYITISELSKKI